MSNNHLSDVEEYWLNKLLLLIKVLAVFCAVLFTGIALLT